MRPTLLCSLCLTVLSAPALSMAQAVPVIAVTVQDRPPPGDLVTRMAAAVGADARHGAALSTEERSELVRLRQKVATLETEREILKKAAAFFAKESS